MSSKSPNIEQVAHHFYEIFLGIDSRLTSSKLRTIFLNEIFPGIDSLALRTETEWQGLLPRMLEQHGWDLSRLLAETEGQGLLSHL